MIGNDYTFSFAGRRYQIARDQAQAGMRHQRLRVELRLDGELKARYQGRYLDIAECGVRAIAAAPSQPSQSAKITTPEARAPGCRVSSIAPARRCGRRSATEVKIQFGRRASLRPKASAQEFHQSNCVLVPNPPRRPVETPGF